jgi:hypothetical protein
MICLVDIKFKHVYIVIINKHEELNEKEINKFKIQNK